MDKLILGESLEVLIDHRGRTPKKLGGDFTQAGVPVISAQIVSGGYVDTSSARNISEEMWQKWMPIKTTKNDVILTSEAPLGRCALIPDKAPYALGQRVFGLRGKKGILDSRFLYFALQSPFMQDQLISRSSGTTVFGIRQAELVKVQVPDPGFMQQQAIAAVLGSLDDKIAVNDHIIAKLSELSTAAFLSSHPKHMVSIPDVSHVTMGQSPPGDTYNETAEGLPFYQGTKDFGFRFPGKRVWCTAAARRASAKDVLVSVRAPVGTINVATEECGIGRGLAAVRSTTHPHTLLQALSADKSIWLPYEKEGTVFGSINKKQFSKLEIPWPEDSSLDEIEERLQSLDDLLAQYTAESRMLAELRDTLLPQLMSGKLRVKDAEKIVEDNV
ncbi:restriction endonuclease subunit S [Nocardiopsis dassonvillei]|uniref:restriction endonuclease subunit S n=1 Tax=Nocardiopsis dassonvillei TaxID=2014 RepID=UPI0033D2807D